MSVLGTFAEDALAGKVCIISGAASGQGRAIARRLAEASAHVVAVDIQKDELADTVTTITASGGRATPVVVDLSTEDCGTAVVDTAIGAYGRVDALLNCAAIAGMKAGLMGTVETTPVEAWDRAFDTNVRSMYLLSQAAIPPLRAAGGGSMVNWSSAAAFKGQHPGSHAYAATKGAVVAMTTAMAVAFGPDRIRVNAIVPGLIDTPMVDGMVAPLREAVAAGRAIPIGRLGTANDVAGLAMFLVSDASSFVTGATIFIDGGANVEQRWDNAVIAASAPSPA